MQKYFVYLLSTLKNLIFLHFYIFYILNIFTEPQFSPQINLKVFLNLAEGETYFLVYKKKLLRFLFRIKAETQFPMIRPSIYFALSHSLNYLLTNSYYRPKKKWKNEQKRACHLLRVRLNDCFYGSGIKIDRQTFSV